VATLVAAAAVLDTYGPLLGERALTPPEDNERRRTLQTSAARFDRALQLTATKIRTGAPADWGEMERPSTRLCDGIYTPGG
jgi:hypothetical protein